MNSINHEHHVAFPRLSEAELKSLAGMAELCSFADGEAVFLAGQRGLSLYVVESGEIAIVDETGVESKTVVVHGPSEFTGDVSLLTDRPAVISAYARGACRAYRVAPVDLRRVIQEIPDLSDKLLEAFQTRRSILERSGFIGVRVFGSLGDPELTVIREFFDKNKVPHTWVDADAAQSDRWPLTDREPCSVETTCPGVFAAGDVRSGSTKRVAFAVGDEALAVTCAHRVLSGI